MSEAKKIMTEIIQSMPEDASYEEILRELAFEIMVQRGLDDSRKGRVIPDDEVRRRMILRRHAVE